jgi:hypothetical protein
VNICNRMMAKRADERYQTAGEISERLTEWLADRGVAVGDSGKRKEPSGSAGGGGGLGSDVFRRFAASMSKVGNDAGNRGSSPGTGSGGGRKPAVAAAKARTEPEEEMVLAPLDDEPPKKVAVAEAPKPAVATTPMTAAANGASHAAAPPIPEKPKKLKSLLEEELDAARAAAPKVRPARKEGEFDPLRPPGFAGPSYGPPGWVYAAIAAGVFVVIGVVAALALGVL